MSSNKNYIYIFLAPSCDSDVGLSCQSGTCLCTDQAQVYNGTLCGNN